MLTGRYMIHVAFKFKACLFESHGNQTCDRTSGGSICSKWPAYFYIPAQLMALASLTGIEIYNENKTVYFNNLYTLVLWHVSKTSNFWEQATHCHWWVDLGPLDLCVYINHCPCVSRKLWKRDSFSFWRNCQRHWSMVLYPSSHDLSNYNFTFVHHWPTLETFLLSKGFFLMTGVAWLSITVSQ